MHAIINKVKSALASLISSQEYSQKRMDNSGEFAEIQTLCRTAFIDVVIYRSSVLTFVKWCVFVARICSNTLKIDGTLISCETSKSFRFS